MNAANRKKFLLHEVYKFHGPLFLTQTETDPQLPNKVAWSPPPMLSYKFRKTLCKISWKGCSLTVPNKVCKPTAVRNDIRRDMMIIT
jgi:hypothetical protein